MEPVPVLCWDNRQALRFDSIRFVSEPAARRAPASWLATWIFSVTGLRQEVRYRPNDSTTRWLKTADGMPTTFTVVAK